jgi:hypothetical protein
MAKNPLPSMATSRSRPVEAIRPGRKSIFLPPITTSTADSSSSANSSRCDAVLAERSVL